MGAPPDAGQARFAEVFRAERAYLDARRQALGLPPIPSKPTGPDPSQGLVGLALSGGGVRSAAFALGALQRLAQTGWLRHIDYLSTVSGGGYLGGALLTQLQDPATGVERDRFPFQYRRDAEVEPPILRHIRRHGGYLAPRGMWSRDGLEMAAVYVIGFLLNLLAFLGFAGLCVAGAILAADLGTAVLETWRGAAGGLVQVLRSPGPWLLALGCTVVAEAVRVGVRRFESPGSTRRLARRMGGTALLTLLVLAGTLAAALFVEWCRAFLAAPVWRIPRVAWLSGSGLAVGGPLLGLAARVLSRNAGLARRSAALAVELLALAVGVGLAALLTLGLLAATDHWFATPGRGWEAILGGAGLRAAVAAGVVGAAAGLRLGVSPGLWSVHHFYRDRLSSAFLIKPGPAGGPLVPADDVLLARVVARPPGTPPLPPGREYDPPAPTGARLPYPIVNATVNLPGSDDNLRRERGAELFQFAPFHCGSEATGYRPTERWADGSLKLATAVAASGAAVSPQMGEFTRPLLAFLLGLFNLRLGLSVPNPAAPGWARHPRRAHLVPPWLRQRHEASPECEVSDGGHFENLGLTSLLRRGCRLIIAIDAEADPKRHFGSLARAARMARIDRRCHIDIDPASLVPGDARRSPATLAVGRIYYAGRSQEAVAGTLVYIKATIPEARVPIDIDSYHRRNPEFPHQSTADQFFDEAQFEAYRELGYQCVRLALLDRALAVHLRREGLPIPDGAPVVPATGDGPASADPGPASAMPRRARATRRPRA